MTPSRTPRLSIRIAPGRRTPFFMDYRNADGSLAEMCGNGVRVVGKYLSDRGHVDTAFDLVADDQGAVTGLDDVVAGPLGGTMKCGSTQSDEGDMSVCGWADHGSLATVLLTRRSVADSAELTAILRSAVLTRG